MIRRYAGTLKKFILSKFGVIAAIVFGSCFAIWFFGKMIKISGNQPLAPANKRLTLIFIILTLYALYLFITFLIRYFKKSKSKVETTEVYDPAAEDIKELNESFSLLKSVLRRNWDKKSSGSYIYALPWYLMIGLSGSGKTSLVVRSGLKFPLAHLFKQDTIRDVQKTNDFDWWVTDDAVIIDSAGHFIMPEKEDTKEDQEVSKKVWLHFISLLKKARKRRPLNGVIIALDAKKLSEQSEDNHVHHAAQIHHRIAELIEKLGTCFSIYVVLTRIDLIEGFEETFQHFSETERSELMGFSFPVDSENINEWQNEFSKEFKAFVERLNLKNLNQFAHVTKTETRQKNWVFIRQLNGLEAIISQFMELALSGDRFSTPPMVRGFFMTSVKQENVPANAWMDTVSDRYGVASPLRPSYRGKSKTWFAHKVFPEVIFKEAGLAGDNIKVEATRQLISWICVALCLALGIIISLNWRHNYNENLAKIKMVDEYLSAYNINETKRGYDPTGAELLTEMNTLRKATFSFENYRDYSILGAAARLYQGRKFGPLADQAYLELLGRGFLTEIAIGIGDDINSMENRVSDERLRALQVYLMLGDKDLRDPIVVSNWMKQKWSKAYYQNEELQNELSGHLSYALKHVNGELVELDDKLIKNAQNDLHSVPLADRIYNEIKELSFTELPNALNLRSEIGAGFDIIYQQGEVITDENGIRKFGDDPYLIPRIFTKDAFYNYFIPRNDEISQIAVKYLYILGLKDKNISLSKTDIEELKSQVRALYVSDYIRTWNEALANIKIRDFKNLKDANEVLKTVNGPTEPFTRLVKTVVRETTLYDAIEEKELERQASNLQSSQSPKDTDLVRISDPYRIEGLRINRSFKPWADLLIAINDDQPPFMEEAYKSLDALNIYIGAINDVQNPNAEALRKANQRLKMEGDDPIYIVRRISTGLPSALSRQFDKLATESWKVILDASSLELEFLWTNKVLSDWNLNLASRYPFNAESQDDVMLEDLEKFFGPKGVLNNFWQGDLAAFIDPTTSEPTIIDGYSLNVSNDFIKSLKEARAISSLFFGIEGNLNVAFDLTPIKMSGGLNRAILNIEGQIVTFNHSKTAPANVIWPNNVNGAPAARLDIFTRGGRNLSRSYQGVWAWYRLMQSGSLSNIRENTAELTLTDKTQKSSITYHIHIKRGSKILLRNPLSDFYLQPVFGKREK